MRDCRLKKTESKGSYDHRTSASDHRTLATNQVTSSESTSESSLITDLRIQVKGKT